MSDDLEHKRRDSDGKLNWQAIAVILSVLMALSAFGKTFFLSDYRLGELEKKVEKLDTKIEAMDSKLVQLDTTYRLLIDQAREHGWNIPWMPRGRK